MYRGKKKKVMMITDLNKNYISNKLGFNFAKFPFHSIVCVQGRDWFW